jgi:hypothetical protein
MHRPPSSLLRNTLRADAVFCALAGVDLVLFSRSVADFLGVADGYGLAFLGVGLLGYAAYLFVASRREPLSFTEAWTFVAADFVWIAGSALLIAFGPLSATGRWIVGIAAVAVLALAEAKMFGIKRLRSSGAALALRHEAA